MHAQYGRLPCAELIAAAIAKAKEGFPVSRRLGDRIAEARDLNRFENVRAHFLGLHVIRIGLDGLTGAADKRREGTVLGDRREKWSEGSSLCPTPSTCLA